MKGEITSGTLVTVAFSLFVLIALLFIVGRTTNLLGDASDVKSCQWNTFLSGTTKLIGVETIPVACKMVQKDVEKTDFNLKKVGTLKSIEKMNKLSATSKKPLEHFAGELSDDKILEYNIDSVVAQELKTCWDKVFMGEFELFNDWTDLIDVSVVGALPTKNKAEQAEIIDKFVQLKGPPTTCIICSRIKFDEAIRATFKDKKIKSLKEYMSFTPVIADKKQRSYYEYTQDDVRKGLFANPMEYSVDEPQAVIYGRVNINYMQQWTSTAQYWGVLPFYDAEKPKSGIDILTVVPYKDVGRVCTYAIG